jgi:predicted homoserine dehydrogenase-like protein
VTASIPKGALLTRENVETPAGSKIAELRRRQDEMIYGRELAHA